MVQVTHSGQMSLGEFKVDCYVLEDSRRVLSGNGMQSALKMLDEDSEPGGTRLARHLNQKTLEPFLYKAKESGHLETIRWFWLSHDGNSCWTCCFYSFYMGVRQRRCNILETTF